MISTDARTIKEGQSVKIVHVVHDGENDRTYKKVVMVKVIKRYPHFVLLMPLWGNNNYLRRFTLKYNEFARKVDEARMGCNTEGI